MRVTFRARNGLVWTREIPAPGLDERTFNKRVERGEFVVLETHDEHPDPSTSPDEAGGEATSGGDLEALRAEYRAVSGRKADRRWGEARLRREIAAARSGEED